MLRSLAGEATLVRVIVMVLAASLVAGCSKQGGAPVRDKDGSQKPEVVVVNEGMSKKEEGELAQRLADLEDRVEDRSTEVPPVEESESTEGAVRDAAEDYYAAAAGGDYGYTYDELSAYSQSRFTEERWVAANTELGSDAAGYSVDSVDMEDDTTAQVDLTVSLPDGSDSGRLTRFISEDGGWKHDLTQEEYDLFAGASNDVASASSTSASASASATPEASESSSTADMDCSDFTTQAAAQAALDTGDPYGLDEDGDGTACETLAGNDQYEAPDQYGTSDPDPDREGSYGRRPGRQTGPSSDPVPSGGGDIDCDEFDGPISTPPGDPNNLDGDGDGLACE